MAGDRATGRSYRIALRALLAASEGKRVLVHCSHADSCNHFLMHRLFPLADGYGEILMRSRQVKFASGGSVTVHHEQMDPNRLRGIRWDVQLRDDDVE